MHKFFLLILMLQLIFSGCMSSSEPLLPIRSYFIFFKKTELNEFLLKVSQFSENDNLLLHYDEPTKAAGESIRHYRSKGDVNIHRIYSKYSPELQYSLSMMNTRVYCGMEMDFFVLSEMNSEAIQKFDEFITELREHYLVEARTEPMDKGSKKASVKLGIAESDIECLD